MDLFERFKEDITIIFAPKLNPTAIIKLQIFFDHPTVILTQKKSINISKIIQFDHKLSLPISNIHFTPKKFICDIS